MNKFIAALILITTSFSAYAEVKCGPEEAYRNGMHVQGMVSKAEWETKGWKHEFWALGSRVWIETKTKDGKMCLIDGGLNIILT